jgi:serine/threonine protein phosphatase 1
MMLCHNRFGEYEIWLSNGGMETISSYRGLDQIPFSHMQFIQETIPYYETEDFIFVHAGIDPKKQLTDQPEDNFMWIRNEFIDNPTNINKIIVYGHTPVFSNPPKHPDKICLDTGAVYGGPLAAVKFPDMKIYMVENCNNTFPDIDFNKIMHHHIDNVKREFNKKKSCTNS